jgi:hypothetical protein
VAGAVILSKLLIENVLGIQLDTLVESWMARAGTGGGAFAVVTLLAADLFLPIPSSVIMVLSGAVFGVLWGSLFSLVGSIGGEWLGFELVRRYGRRASSKMVGDDELERLGRVFERHGARSRRGDARASRRHGNDERRRRPVEDEPRIVSGGLASGNSADRGGLRLCRSGLAADGEPGSGASSCSSLLQDWVGLCFERRSPTAGDSVRFTRRAQRGGCPAPR